MGNKCWNLLFQPKLLSTKNDNQVPQFQTSKVEFVQRTFPIKFSFKDPVVDYMTVLFGWQQISYLRDENVLEHSTPMAA